MAQENLEIRQLTEELLKNYKKESVINPEKLFEQPDRQTVNDILDKLIKIVFPAFYPEKGYRFYNVESRLTVLIEDVYYNLNKQIALALHFDERMKGKSEEEIRAVSEDYTVQFMKKLPEIREYLDTDIEALYVGDPAAESKDAIIIAYPGLFAISVQRYAHVLYQLGIPILPRVMTEIAHSKTGIDINPGATIGKYFFIDHGTGVVVGETTVIGENVKIYQGVTLGALSTRGGRGLIDKKRHPTIEDNVTIYSGASILGGDTVIGEGSVIGGNVFLTKSVPAGTKVHVANQELKFDGQAFEKNTDDKQWFYII